jgi:AcrR family transcriptional regulator
MSKGLETRERIVDHAFGIATRDGLGGLSIGSLATELKMSKSGLFAHFGSKEDLQLAVLMAAAARFEHTVVRPAFRAPRGEPRLRRLFEQWLRWADGGEAPGGCLFIAAATELDDHDGRPRAYLVQAQRELLAAIAKAASIAIDEGHFRADLDPDQLAFDLYGIVLAYNHQHRLIREPRAGERAHTSFERLMSSAAKKRR